MKGQMSKISKGEKKVFGPAKALVCGFAPAKLPQLSQFFQEFGLQTLGVGLKHKSELIKDIVNQENLDLTDTEKLPPAVILGGIKEKDLHLLLQKWPSLGLGQPLFAVYTPHSWEWTLAYLLKHLLEERAKFQG
ncbi:MAG: hypothetical protein PWR24_1284 [Desulfonauticus sp.]|jgi:hypothetical protein|nr:MAG: hypothetical protein XD41_1223 [Desulfonauticus sp. 38_4375]MDK2921727.1 hypothetical protein [Desulfonauticus sp.]